MNNYIKKYLDFYCKKDNKLPFAVLIRGKWGSGKSFFIKEYIDGKKSFLYISLYGLSDVSEIDNKIFEQLHPILSNKKFKLGSKALMSVAKLTTGINIFGDSDKDLTVDSSGVTKINFDEFLKNSENKILIFDDVERTNIDMEKLLGYINSFVEFHSQKVIILMNEEKFLGEKKVGTKKDEKKNDNEKNKKYREIKEKTIGKEFEIRTQYHEAIKYFIKNINDQDLKKYKKTIEVELIQIFEEMKYNNLRLLEKSLIDFEYIFSNFSKNFKNISKNKKNKEIVFAQIFYQYLIYYIEFKGGYLPQDFFEKEWLESLSGIVGKEEESVVFRPDKTLFNKYTSVVYYGSYFFDNTDLNNLFKGKKISEENWERINKKINKFIVGEEEWDWKKLWHWKKYLEDRKFFEDLNKIRKKWKKKEYDNFYEVLHLLAIFIFFSKINFIDEEVNDIIKEGEEYIEYMFKNKLIPELDIYDIDIMFSEWSHSAYSTDYYAISINNEKTTKEWTQILNFIIKNYKKNRKIIIEDKLKNIFYEKLSKNELTKSFVNYDFMKNQSYFQFLDCDKIKKSICSSINNHGLWLNILKDRYDKNKLEINKKLLKNEEKFLKDLKKKFESEKEEMEKKHKNSPKIYRINTFLNTFKEILENKK